VTSSPSIVWFRQDLRLADNPALAAAVSAGGPIIPLYIFAPEEEGSWIPGAASSWWLHQSLKSMAEDFRGGGSSLLFRKGPAETVLRELVRETGAAAVFWNRRYEPACIVRDSAVKEALRRNAVRAESFNSSLIFEPWDLKTQAGGPYQVFTPFWKAARRRTAPPLPREAPKTWRIFPGKLASLALEDFHLEPKVPWDGGLREAWEPGEKGAQHELDRFLDSGLLDYPEKRDRPAVAGTSRLSPHLHFGELSPRQVWQALQQRASQDRRPGIQRGTEGYLRQLGWREFAYHLLYHFPETVDRPLRKEFERFPWKRDPESLRAWQRGQTGYPIVDAGMRELWKTGWMHNRVRMIVASFLVKDLLQPWQEGARWFWDTLVDADLANNTLGWQWTAGCGADAAPYFRIFNPVSQGEKFDSKGGYVRRWVPELAKLPDEFLHRPWEAGLELLNKSGVFLGENYPYPIVDHAAARALALHALGTIKKK